MQQYPLLQTKLYIPPIRPELVSRPRLVERLNAALHRKLSLVSAPAGFGKTTLLSEWVSGISWRVAWLSLDEGDNDPSRFLAYLVAALQTVEGNVGQGVLAALQSPGPVNVEPILTTLINEIARLPDGLVLVMDDYHVIESQPVDKALTFLLDHLPPLPGGMHLVIASRIDPSLPLSRLRAGGQMTEIRESDLRFTPEEVAAFLDKAMGLDLSAENVAVLGTRTEGWIAGLQLAALALQGTLSMQGLKRSGDIADFVNSFTGSDRYIQDYLADEVLQRRPKGTEEFLLQTSILDRMTASLCNVVTGREDSQAILEALEAANLFIVPLDNERRWYRYHHLFADLLRQRLQQQRPEQVAGFHIRASAWYEECGLEIEALHHAAAANDFERAARLAEGDGNLLYFRGEVNPVLTWLESLPAAFLDARPSLWVMYAEVLMTTGSLARGKEAYQAAESALKNPMQDAYARDLLGRIANGRASLAIGRRQPETAIPLAQRALNLLLPGNLAIRAAVSFTLGYAYQLQGDRASASQALADAIATSQASENAIVTLMATIRLGSVQASENRLRQAAETYQRALQLAGEQPLPYAGEAHLGLARILYEWNDLNAAQDHGRQGAILAGQLENAATSIACEVFLARLKLVQGDVAGAGAILDEVSQSVRQPGFTFRKPEVAAAQVLTLLRQGDLSAAARLAQVHELPISQARVHLAQGDTEAALAALEPYRQLMEAKGWQDEMLKVKVLQAVALHARGEKDKAVYLLSDVLALAKPEGFIRTFVDEGAPMAHLLSQAAARRLMPDYTAELLAAFDDAAKDEQRKTELLPSSLVEPLSERELEVLQLIAQGLSNREIGERLFLALNTVKGHNSRIYAKLGVKNRTQAINKARALSILPPQ